MLTRFYPLSMAFLLVAGLSAPAVLADDEESMDSIWAAEQNTAKKNAVPATSIDSETEAASDAANKAATVKSTQATTQSDASAKPSTVPDAAIGGNAIPAPLVKIDEFKSSHFVKHGGWPGIGPFEPKLDEPDTYADQAGNSVDLRVNDDQITEATLKLVNKSTTYDDFLDLEVASDFLLEGLNVKPNAILDFNQHLEEAKDNILNLTSTQPISINAGHYLANLNKVNDAEGKLTFVLNIASKDVSSEIAKHSTTTEKGFLGQKLGGIFNRTPSKSQPSSDAKVKDNAEAKEALKAPPLMETFAKTIQSWQDIKKVAVRQRKSEDISQVLAGRALIRQTDAIKWLATNHKYYDMTPKGITVERYNELVPGQKYAVFVDIKEVSKLVDDATGQVVKEQDDSYKVNYTIEKLDGHYKITDSAVVDKTSAPTVTHTQSGKTR